MTGKPINRPLNVETLDTEVAGSFPWREVGMKFVPLETLQIEDPPLREFYEANAIATMRAVWRRKWLILLIVIVAAALAVFSRTFVEKRYTAEALIQFDFARSDSARAANPAPPSATIDGSVLVESEARIIRSRPLARAVVERLRLDQDPAYFPRPSITSRIQAFVKSPLSPSLAPPALPIPPDVVASELMKNLAVTNDARSYLISIAYTSKDPNTSAKMANAFATEYLEGKLLQRLHASEAAAKAELVRLSASYGARHPSVVRAAADLAEAQARLVAEQGQGIGDDYTRFLSAGLTPAEPTEIPVGPRAIVVLFLTIVGALAAGITLVLLLERRDRGFRTELKMVQETGTRCVGMVPHVARSSRRQSGGEEIREAMSAISLVSGVTGTNQPHRVILLTSSIPREGKSFVASAMSDFLAAHGHRVLLVDGSPGGAAGAQSSLEEILADEQSIQALVEARRDEPITRIVRTTGPSGGHALFASPKFERFLKQARELYDYIIVEAPPVLLLADATLLGRLVDAVYHIAKWDSTPRKTVNAALRRLSDSAVRIGGVILNDVHLRRHGKYAIKDQAYYFRRYRTFYSQSSRYTC